jgi:hypothetical protein
MPRPSSVLALVGLFALAIAAPRADAGRPGVARAAIGKVEHGAQRWRDRRAGRGLLRALRRDPDVARAGRRGRVAPVPSARALAIATGGAVTTAAGLRALVETITGAPPHDRVAAMVLSTVLAGAAMLVAWWRVDLRPAIRAAEQRAIWAAAEQGHPLLDPWSPAGRANRALLKRLGYELAR